jgi:hypothetical protein
MEVCVQSPALAISFTVNNLDMNNSATIKI